MDRFLREQRLDYLHKKIQARLLRNLVPCAMEVLATRSGELRGPVRVATQFDRLQAHSVCCPHLPISESWLWWEI